jgi:hypothetical protein
MPGLSCRRRMGLGMPAVDFESHQIPVSPSLASRVRRRERRQGIRRASDGSAGVRAFFHGARLEGRAGAGAQPIGIQSHTDVLATLGRGEAVGRTRRRDHAKSMRRWILPDPGRLRQREVRRPLRSVSQCEDRGGADRDRTGDLLTARRPLRSTEKRGIVRASTRL